MPILSKADHEKLWAELRVLSDIAQKAGVVILTATQFEGPERHLPCNFLTGESVIIDYVSTIGGYHGKEK